MSPRTDVLARQYVLPFLAPRVFQPWPLMAESCAENVRWKSKSKPSRNTDKSVRRPHPTADQTGSLTPVGNRYKVVGLEVPRRACTAPALGGSASAHQTSNAAQRYRTASSCGSRKVSRGQLSAGQHHALVIRSCDVLGKECSSMLPSSRRLVHTASSNPLLDFTLQDVENRSDIDVKPHEDQDQAIRDMHLLLDTETQPTLRSHWIRIGAGIRADCWPNLVLETLRNRPQHVRKLLAVTMFDNTIERSLCSLVDLFFSPDLEKSSVLDATQSLKDLDSMWSKPISGPVDVTLRDIYAVVIEVLRNREISLLGQHAISSMISYMSDSQLVTFLRDLEAIGHDLMLDNLLHFASRLAKTNADGVEVAIHILRTLAERREDFSDPRVMSVCTIILCGVRQFNEPGAVATRFQELLSMGMEVNVISYTVLMLSAIDIGDWETAWGIHDMMLDSKSPPDAHTYSVLLNDAKWRQDTSSVDKAVKLAQLGGFGNDAYIVTDLLHHIFLLRERERERQREQSTFAEGHSFSRERGMPRTQGLVTRSAVPEMLQKYVQHFRTAPLLKLVPYLWTSLEPNDTQDNDKLQAPNIPALHVILSAILMDSSSSQTRIIYDNFLSLIGTRDPVALSLAKEQYIWAMFLKALGRSRDQLDQSIQLVKHMASLRAELLAEDAPSDPQAEVRTELSQSSLNDPIPEPNVYTWSILVDTLTKHKQMRSAEKVVAAMKTHGIEPNLVTWTTLVWGYCKLQQSGNVVDTVHSMQASGVRVGKGVRGAMWAHLNRQALGDTMIKLKQLHKRKATSGGAISTD